MVGFHGTRFDAELRDFLDDLRPAGVILFARNIADPVQVALLNRDIQRRCHERDGEGIFIGVDQEGGRVRRLVDPFTEFPPALELAAAMDSDAAVRRFAETTAKELRLAGFNLDFVPVLDVVQDSAELASSVIGDRSFGADPGVVTRLGSIVIEAMTKQGVISCCKHFPGHGGTRVDSHLDLPVDSRDARSIEETDLLPFAAAVQGGVGMVMTAHVRYPDLDDTACATLSRTILEDLLRSKLGYDGVIITDDLDMGAVANHHTPEDACVLAMQAGADILLICNRPRTAIQCRTRLMEALKSGEIAEDRVKQSLVRIHKLKHRFRKYLVHTEEAAFLDHINLD